MKHTFWLSFCDLTLEPGKQFLGVSLVEVNAGDTVVEATRIAWQTGCNPGGQVAGFDKGTDFEPQVPRNTLLSVADLESYGVIGRRIPLPVPPTSVRRSRSRRLR